MSSLSSSDSCSSEVVPGSQRSPEPTFRKLSGNTTERLFLKSPEDLEELKPYGETELRFFVIELLKDNQQLRDRIETQHKLVVDVREELDEEKRLVDQLRGQQRRRSSCVIVADSHISDLEHEAAKLFSEMKEKDELLDQQQKEISELHQKVKLEHDDLEQSVKQQSAQCKRLEKSLDGAARLIHELNELQHTDQKHSQLFRQVVNKITFVLNSRSLAAKEEQSRKRARSIQYDHWRHGVESEELESGEEARQRGLSCAGHPRIIFDSLATEAKDSGGEVALRLLQCRMDLASEKEVTESLRQELLARDRSIHGLQFVLATRRTLMQRSRQATEVAMAEMAERDELQQAAMEVTRQQLAQVMAELDALTHTKWCEGLEMSSPRRDSIESINATQQQLQELWEDLEDGTNLAGNADATPEQLAQLMQEAEREAQEVARHARQVAQEAREAEAKQRATMEAAQEQLAQLKMELEELKRDQPAQLQMEQGQLAEQEARQAAQEAWEVETKQQAALQCAEEQLAELALGLEELRQTSCNGSDRAALFCAAQSATQEQLVWLKVQQEHSQAAEQTARQAAQEAHLAEAKQRDALEATQVHLAQLTLELEGLRQESREVREAAQEAWEAEARHRADLGAAQEQLAEFAEGLRGLQWEGREGLAGAEAQLRATRPADPERPAQLQPQQEQGRAAEREARQAAQAQAKQRLSKMSLELERLRRDRWEASEREARSRAAESAAQDRLARLRQELERAADREATLSAAHSAAQDELVLLRRERAEALGREAEQRVALEAEQARLAQATLDLQEARQAQQSQGAVPWGAGEVMKEQIAQLLWERREAIEREAMHHFAMGVAQEQVSQLKQTLEDLQQARQVDAAERDANRRAAMEVVSKCRSLLAESPLLAGPEAAYEAQPGAPGAGRPPAQEHGPPRSRSASRVRVVPPPPPLGHPAPIGGRAATCSHATPGGPVPAPMGSCPPAGRVHSQPPLASPRAAQVSTPQARRSPHTVSRTVCTPRLAASTLPSVELYCPGGLGALSPRTPIACSLSPRALSPACPVCELCRRPLADTLRPSQALDAAPVSAVPQLSPRRLHTGSGSPALRPPERMVCIAARGRPHTRSSTPTLRLTEPVACNSPPMRPHTGKNIPILRLPEAACVSARSGAASPVKGQSHLGSPGLPGGCWVLKRQVAGVLETWTCPETRAEMQRFLC